MPNQFASEARMRPALIGLSGFFLFPLCGCATTISAIKARPVAAHNAYETRLWTSTGERRFVTWLYRGGNNFLLCPEPVPFTAQAITSSSKPGFARPEIVTLSNDEAFGTSLTTVGTLTERLAALDRNFANSCNLFVAGIIDGAELASQVRVDNLVRRQFVLISAMSEDEKALQAKIDAAVKAALEKQKKDSSAGGTEKPKPQAQ
jgi:hypothetical protein